MAYDWSMQGAWLQKRRLLFMVIGSLIGGIAATAAAADAPPELEAGKLALGRDQIDQAIRLLSEAIAKPDLSPDLMAKALDDRGIAYHRKGENALAIDDYSHAINLTPNDARAIDNRANAYFSMGQNDRAIQDYTEAIRLDPANARAINNRGAVLFSERKYDEALEDFDRSIELNAHGSDAYANRGNLYFRFGQFAEAEADFRRSIQIKPRATTLIRLYLSVERRGKDGQATLRQYAPLVDSTDWPSPILHFFLGAVPADDVLAVARSSREDLRRDHVCEADFYLGEQALIGGRNDSARKFLQLAAASCDPRFIEREDAEQELMRLKT